MVVLLSNFTVSLDFWQEQSKSVVGLCIAITCIGIGIFEFEHNTKRAVLYTIKPMMCSHIRGPRGISSCNVYAKRVPYSDPCSDRKVVLGSSTSI